jgi:hypothetical protein
MRPLFVPIFAVLTAVAHADQFFYPPVRYFAMPEHEVVTIYEKPSYPSPEIVYVDEYYPTSRGVVTSSPHIAAKPTEKENIVLRPLESLPTPTLPQPIPLAPRLPEQTEEQSHEIVRGQITVDKLAGVLDSPPPLAQGAVEEGTIEPKLLGTTDTPELSAEGLEESVGQGATPTTTTQETKLADPLGYTMLLIATAVTTIGLLYMVFIAYDYRQRWMQSLTMQNDRYLGVGALDMEKTEDTYGSYSGSSSFSDGLGLSRRSI